MIWYTKAQERLSKKETYSVLREQVQSVVKEKNSDIVLRLFDKYKEEKSSRNTVGVYIQQPDGRCEWREEIMTVSHNLNAPFAEDTWSLTSNQCLVRCESCVFWDNALLECNCEGQKGIKVVANDFCSKGKTKYQSSTSTRLVHCKDCEYFDEHYGKCHRPVLIVGDIEEGVRWTNESGEMALTDAEPDGFCAWGKIEEEQNTQEYL